MDARTFHSRRHALRRALPAGAILLPGNGPAPRNYAANAYPFRQDSHFLYFCGGRRPGLALLLEPDGGELLLGPPEDPADMIWTGPEPGLEARAEASGLARTAPLDRLPELLAELRGRGVRIHYLPPYRAERTVLLAGWLGVPPAEVARGASAELAAAVAAARSRKEPAEVARIEEALAVTAEMVRSACLLARPGRREAEVAGALLGVALARGCQPSFSPIVSVRGEVLHNESYDNTLAAGDLLMVDCGAETPDGYAADITRTLPVAGRFTTQQREIYQVVLAANEAAIAAARPGVANRELHLLAARTVAAGLAALGLMRGDPEEAVAAGAHALFFPHGLGHMLGLDVHDMEDLGDVVGYAPGEKRSEQFGLCYLRLARRLEPGFVLTVEPGLYFIPALLDAWAAARRHAAFIVYDRLEPWRRLGGIRLEDDILITEKGCRVLGRPIPKAPDHVEAAMAAPAGP